MHDRKKYLNVPKKIYAHGINRFSSEDEFNQHKDMDSAIIQMEMEDGSLGVIQNTRKSFSGYIQEARVWTTEGDFELTTGAELSENFFQKRYADSFKIEMATFIQCIQENKSFPVTEDEALSAQFMAFMALESYKKGCPIATQTSKYFQDISWNSGLKESYL